MPGAQRDAHLHCQRRCLMNEPLLRTFANLRTLIAYQQRAEEQQRQRLQSDQAKDELRSD